MANLTKQRHASILNAFVPTYARHTRDVHAYLTKRGEGIPGYINADLSTFKMLPRAVIPGGDNATHAMIQAHLSGNDYVPNIGNDSTADKYVLAANLDPNSVNYDVDGASINLEGIAGEQFFSPSDAAQLFHYSKSTQYMNGNYTSDMVLGAHMKGRKAYNQAILTQKLQQKPTPASRQTGGVLGKGRVEHGRAIATQTGNGGGDDGGGSDGEDDFKEGKHGFKGEKDRDFKESPDKDDTISPRLHSALQRLDNDGVEAYLHFGENSSDDRPPPYSLIPSAPSAETLLSSPSSPNASRLHHIPDNDDENDYPPPGSAGESHDQDLPEPFRVHPVSIYGDHRALLPERSAVPPPTAEEEPIAGHDQFTTAYEIEEQLRNTQMGIEYLEAATYNGGGSKEELATLDSLKRTKHKLNKKLAKMPKNPHPDTLSKGPIANQVSLDDAFIAERKDEEDNFDADEEDVVHQKPSKAKSAQEIFQDAQEHLDSLTKEPVSVFDVATNKKIALAQQAVREAHGLLSLEREKSGRLAAAAVAKAEPPAAVAQAQPAAAVAQAQPKSAQLKLQEATTRLRYLENSITHDTPENRARAEEEVRKAQAAVIAEAALIKKPTTAQEKLDAAEAHLKVIINHGQGFLNSTHTAIYQKAQAAVSDAKALVEQQAIQPSQHPKPDQAEVLPQAEIPTLPSATQGIAEMPMIQNVPNHEIIPFARSKDPLSESPKRVKQEASLYNVNAPLPGSPFAIIAQQEAQQRLRREYLERFSSNKFDPENQKELAGIKRFTYDDREEIEHNETFPKRVPLRASAAIRVGKKAGQLKASITGSKRGANYRVPKQRQLSTIQEEPEPLTAPASNLPESVSNVVTPILPAPAEIPPDVASTEALQITKKKKRSSNDQAVEEGKQYLANEARRAVADAKALYGRVLSPTKGRSSTSAGPAGNTRRKNQPPEGLLPNGLTLLEQKIILDARTKSLFAETDEERDEELKFIDKLYAIGERRNKGLNSRPAIFTPEAPPEAAEDVDPEADEGDEGSILFKKLLARKAKK